MMEIKLEELVSSEKDILRFLKNCRNNIHIYKININNEEISVATDGYQKELDDVFVELGNYVLKKKAEKVFEELFIKNMYVKNIQSFKRNYRTLYNKVIIPAMLKFREDGK